MNTTSYCVIQEAITGDLLSIWPLLSEAMLHWNDWVLSSVKYHSITTECKLSGELLLGNMRCDGKCIKGVVFGNFDATCYIYSPNVPSQEDLRRIVVDATNEATANMRRHMAGSAIIFRIDQLSKSKYDISLATPEPLDIEFEELDRGCILAKVYYRRSFIIEEVTEDV